MKEKKITFDHSKQELIKPIFPGFNISIFTTTFSPHTYEFINWHWHQAFQYCYVTEGIIDIKLPRQTYSIKKGDGFFINYQQIHLIKQNKSVSTASYICLDIPPSFIAHDNHGRIYSRYINPILKSPIPATLKLSGNESNSKNILNKIINIQQLIKETPELFEVDVEIDILEIFKETYLLLKSNSQDSDEVPQSYYENDRLKQILSFIQNHYQEKITLEEIAKSVSISKSECSRFFKKVTGESLFNYLILYRINKSIDLIRDTNLSIAEIATSVGFSDQSYYTKCFKEQKKITPKKFKELSIRQPTGILSYDF